MKILCLLPLLATLVLPGQNTPTPPADGSQVAVLSFKGSRSRQAVAGSASDKPLPSRAVTTADKNLERNTRVNDPAGSRDPNAQSSPLLPIFTPLAYDSSQQFFRVRPVPRHRLYRVSKALHASEVSCREAHCSDSGA